MWRLQKRRRRMIKQGLAIHCHHDMLLEHCYDYDERVEAIKRNKPQNEQEIRLRLFKILPQEAIDDLPERFVKAYDEWDKARVEWKKADAEWQKANAEWKKAYAELKKANAEWKKAYAELKKADAEREKAYAEWNKADTEWNKADTEWQNVDQDVWHKKLCNCKEWNGKEIVF
jgi:DNA polymerase III alpha subunit (gram-positive type)